MTSALLSRNLRRHGALLLSLSLGLVAIEFLIVWMMAQIDTGPGLFAILEQLLPPAIRGLVESQIGLMSFAGGVAFGFRHPGVLVAAFAWCVVAGTIPAGERETGLLDLILSRPVPRVRYLIAVVLHLAAGCLLLPASLLVGAALGLAVVSTDGEPSWTRYLASAAGLAELMLAVGGYTLWLAAGARRRGLAIAQAVGVTLVFFWVDLLALVWAPIEPLRWLTPFRYFDPIRTAMDLHSSWRDPLVLLAVFVLAAGLAFPRFGRQDL